MRQSRDQNRWAAAVATLTCLVVLAFATSIPVRADETPTPTATPTVRADATATLGPTATPAPAADPKATPAPTSTPTSTPGPTQTAAPTETPAPTGTPSPADADCDETFAQTYPFDHVVRGESARIELTAFEPNAVVAISLYQWTGDPTSIGTGQVDAEGHGVLRVLIPRTTPMGDAELQIASEHCIAYSRILVLGSSETMTIDDDSVLPGQVVVLTADGFRANRRVGLTIDNHPVQGECYPRQCRLIGQGEADAIGVAVIRLRIPGDIRPGKHRLFATGYSPDDFGSDLTDGVAITVVGATGTLPPTDTE